MENTEKVELVNYYIDTYLLPANKGLIAIENYFNKDYMDIHKILEIFEAVRLKIEANEAPAAIRAYIDEQAESHRKMFEKFIMRTLQTTLTKTSRDTTVDTSETDALFKNRIDPFLRQGSMDPARALKELRKIEEEVFNGNG